MKTWQRIFSAALIVVVTFATVLILNRHQKECCLCNSIRYHAPCLVDLETGELIELALYDPHPTKTAELAEKQFMTDTFSFVRLGDVTGIKLTGSRTIELEVPLDEKTNRSTLCIKCQRLLRNGCKDRYVLADLYNLDEITLITIADNLTLNIRCYEIAMTMEVRSGRMLVTVRGTLY